MLEEKHKNKELNEACMIDKELQDILKLAGLKVPLAEQNEDGEESPFTHGDENVAMVRGEAEVNETVVDEADVEEDFLAPKPAVSGGYDDVEEVMETDDEYQDIDHHCTAEEIGHCKICGDWMDPMGTVHSYDSDPLKAYEAKGKKAKKVAKPVTDDEDDDKDVGDKIVDIGDDEEFDFESEFDKTMGSTRGMYEMNELRRLAGLGVIAEEGESDVDADLDAFGKRMRDTDSEETFASKLKRNVGELPEPVVEVFADRQTEYDGMQAFTFDNEKAFYLAQDYVGAALDFGANDEVLVPEGKADKLCDLLVSSGFVHGKDFTELSSMDEDLQNGYNDHHMVDGEDLFPKGATSQPAGDIGPGGAKHGDNPMSTRMKTAEDKIYEGYRKAYRQFRRQNVNEGLTTMTAATVHAAGRKSSKGSAGPLNHDIRVGDKVKTSAGEVGTASFVNGGDVHVKGTNSYYPDKVTHHKGSELTKV